MPESITTPPPVDEEGTQFMDHYSQMTGPAQHVIIVVLFLAILAGIVILRDMLKTAAEPANEE